MTLSAEEFEQYQELGYVLKKSLFSSRELAAYDKRFHEFIMGERSLPEAMKIMQDVMVVKGALAPQTPIHGVNKLLCLENDEVLFGFARAPQLISVVQALIGKEFYSIASNVFNKPPGLDGRHPMHQDLRYFKLRPAKSIVGVWTAMLPATREHGCLAVLPGSHQGVLMEHDLPDWAYVNHGFYGVRGIDFQARVHVDMEPGDTLFFHPLIVHGSGRNRSGEFRRAISAHFAAGSCTSERENWQSVGMTRRIA